MEKVITTFPSIRSACIAGFGEPLTSKEVFNNAKYLTEKGIHTSLITNGSLVCKHIDHLTKIKFEYVNVSMNAVSPLKYFHTTGLDIYYDIIAGIKKLVKASKFPVTMSYVCLKDRVDDIPRFAELCNELGISYSVVVNSLPYDDTCIDGIIKETDTDVIEKLNKYKAMPDCKIIRKWPIPLKAEPLHKCNSPYNSIGINGALQFTGCRRCLPPTEPFDKKCWNDTNKYIHELRKSVKGQGKYSEYCNNCFGNNKG
jgi:MoaA/NifB/PqqE/SkfB family radical SAM enzyme